MRRVPTRPLLITEDHRAVFEGDLAPVVARMGDDVGPDLEGDVPIGVNMQGSVAAAECIDNRHPHMTRRDDHLLQMFR